MMMTIPSSGARVWQRSNFLWDLVYHNAKDYKKTEQKRRDPIPADIKKSMKNIPYCKINDKRYGDVLKKLDPVSGSLKPD